MRTSPVIGYNRPALGLEDRGLSAEEGIPLVIKLPALLQACLLFWGAFGQNTLLLASNYFHFTARLVTVPARAIMLLLAVCLLVALFMKLQRFHFSLVHIGFVAFWSVYLTRLSIDSALQLNLPIDVGRLDLQFIAQMAIGASFLPGLIIMSTKFWEFHRIALWASIALVAASATMIISMYGVRLFQFSNRISSDSVVGEYDAVHSLTMGYRGTILGVFAMYWLFCAKDLGLKRILMGMAMATLAVILLVGSASRGPMVTVAVVFLFLMFGIARKFDWRRFFTMLGGGVFAIVSIGIYTRITGSTVLDRLFGLASAVEARGEGAERIDLYMEAWEQFLISPIYGSTLTLREGSAYPHNLILEVLMSTGILGLLPLLFILLAGVRESWWIITKRTEFAWIPLLFMVFMVGGMFSWAIYTNTELWLTLGATVSLGAWLRRRPDHAAPGAIA